jgi:hypothetical protein
MDRRGVIAPTKARMTIPPDIIAAAFSLGKLAGLEPNFSLTCCPWIAPTSHERMAWLAGFRLSRVLRDPASYATIMRTMINVPKGSAGD